jgi:hypothetical protein
MSAVLFPALFLLVHYRHIRITGKMMELRLASEPVPLLEMIPLLARWIYTTLPNQMGGWDRLASLSLLFALLFYCGIRAFRFLRGSKADHLLALVSLTMLAVLTSLMLVYRYNPSSSPTLQFLPFVCIALGGMQRDAVVWLGDRLGRVNLRPAIAGGVGALIVASALIRMPSYLESFFRDYSFPRHGEQKEMVRLLLKRDVTAPLVLSSFQNGVFEFLSGGKIRPFYLTREQCRLIDDTGWDRILHLTRGQASDFLFSATRSPLDPANRCNPEAGELFRQALARSGRGEIRRERVRTAGGGRIYDLFTVAPDRSRVPVR